MVDSDIFIVDISIDYPGQRVLRAEGLGCDEVIESKTSVPRTIPSSHAPVAEPSLGILQLVSPKEPVSRENLSVQMPEAIHIAFL